MLQNQLDQCDSPRLRTDIDWQKESVLELVALAREGDHGEQAVAKNWLVLSQGTQLFHDLCK